MGKGDQKRKTGVRRVEGESSQKLVSVTYVANTRGGGSWPGSLA